MIRKMDKVSLNGVMEEFMMENGNKGNNMDMVYILIILVIYTVYNISIFYMDKIFPFLLHKKKLKPI